MKNKSLKKIGRCAINIGGDLLKLIGDTVDFAFQLMWRIRVLCLKGLLSLMKLMKVKYNDPMYDWGERPFESKQREVKEKIETKEKK